MPDMEGFEIARFISSVVATIFWVALGVALLIVAAKVIDFVDKGIDFQAEILKGNIAVAILISAYLLGLACIIATVIRS